MGCEGIGLLGGIVKMGVVDDDDAVDCESRLSSLKFRWTAMLKLEEGGVVLLA